MTEPLPCPFCGHVGVSVVQTDTHKWRAAQCDNCGAQSGDVRWIYTEEDPDASAHARAIEEWNKRHPTIPEVSLTNHMEGLTPGQAFQRCINVTNHRDGRSTIRCKLGLWSVSGPYMNALREAKGYWIQYAEDGEYASLLANPQD